MSLIFTITLVPSSGPQTPAWASGTRLAGAPTAIGTELAGQRRAWARIAIPIRSRSDTKKSIPRT